MFLCPHIYVKSNSPVGIYLCSILLLCTFLLGLSLLIIVLWLLIWDRDRGFFVLYICIWYKQRQLLWFTNAVPLPFLKLFSIYFNNGTFFTRKALIVFFFVGGLFFRESYQRQEWQSQRLRTVKIIEMHLKYQVIGKNFADAICHGDERQLTICVQILAWLLQRAVFNVAELYSGCVYVHVCAFYQFSNFSPFFSSLLGSMIERILVSCNNQQDLHEWVDHLQKQTKVTSVSNPPIKPHSVPSHTVRTPYFSCLQTPRVSFWLSCQQVVK